MPPDWRLRDPNPFGEHPGGCRPECRRCEPPQAQGRLSGMEGADYETVGRNGFFVGKVKDAVIADSDMIPQ